MPNYTVRDNQTGKTITFAWNGTEPPTDADMEEVFTAARSIPSPSPQSVTKQKPSGLSETPIPDAFNKAVDLGTRFIKQGVERLGQTLAMPGKIASWGREHGLENIWGLKQDEPDIYQGMKPVMQGLRDIGGAVSDYATGKNTPPGQAVGNILQGTKEGLTKFVKWPISSVLSWANNNPFDASLLVAPVFKGLSTLADAGGFVKGAEVLGKAGTLTDPMTVLGKTTSTVGKAVLPKTWEQHLTNATNRFKSVVPGFKTSKNPDMAKNADMIMRDLVRQNDAGLLTTMDDTGQSVPGLPTQFKNKKMGLNYPVDDRNYMADMMDTIQQGQANTAKEMMDVLQRATGKGVTITDNAVADGLQKVLDDLGPGGRERGRTGFAKLLEDRIQELRTEGKTWTPEQMQQWAAGINAKAKNVTVGSIETNNQMALAGAEARAVKRALESVVDGVKDGSGELGQLKRRYAAYKSFEDDLRSRLGKSVQQENAINGVDLFDMYSATRMLAGITGGHPAAIPQALAVQAMKGINKTAKNISTNMYRTFLDLEKASKKYTPTPKPPTSAQYAPVTPMQNMKSQVLNERRQGILEGLRDYRGPNNLVE